jgi:hypothetical protein
MKTIQTIFFIIIAIVATLIFSISLLVQVVANLVSLPMLWSNRERCIGVGMYGPIKIRKRVYAKHLIVESLFTNPVLTVVKRLLM